MIRFRRIPPLLLLAPLAACAGFGPPAGGRRGDAFARMLLGFRRMENEGFWGGRRIQTVSAIELTMAGMQSAGLELGTTASGPLGIFAAVLDNLEGGEDSGISLYEVWAGPALRLEPERGLELLAGAGPLLYAGDHVVRTPYPPGKEPATGAGAGFYAHLGLGLDVGDALSLGLDFRRQWTGDAAFESASARTVGDADGTTVALYFSVHF